MKSEADRRSAPRVASRFTLRFRTIPGPGEGSLLAQVKDVSRSGIRFRIPRFVPLRQRFVVEMHIPGSSPVTAIAHAAWVRERPGHDGFEVGGRFVEETSAAGAALERHLLAATA